MYAICTFSVPRNPLQTSPMRALLPVPGGPLTYKHRPLLVSIPLRRKLFNSSLSVSRPTSRPGSALLTNSCRASLYKVGIAPGVEGVLGTRGVAPFPARRTRCRGVTGIFLDKASRCRGVCGVASCTFSLSSGALSARLTVTRHFDLLMSVAKSLVLPLALVGDNAVRLLLTALLGEEDGLREDFDGVRKGSSSSSKSMTSPF